MLRRILNLLTLTILASLFCSTGALQAEVIETDTVWSGDILIADKVVVEEGSTLLIMPGSRVTFRPVPSGAEKGGSRLIIFGRLIAQGTQESPILFSSAAASPQPGDWEGLRFEKASTSVNRIDYCIIEYARTGIVGRSSSLQVTSSHFRYNKIGFVARTRLLGSLFDCTLTKNNVGVRFEQNDHLQLINCNIMSNKSAGIICSNSSPAIQNSLIKENGKHGIACLRGSSPLTENNLIKGHQYGIWAEMISSPTILHNEITRNDTAIGLERLSFAIIEYNLIRHNRIGIYCHLGGYPHVHRNNIYNNREFAIDLGTYQSIIVARSTPFDRRVAMNLPKQGENRDRGLNQNSEIKSALPQEGLIDAYGNWWGERSLKELKSGESDNLSLFEDGFDTPTLEYRDNIYPRDRVGYAGWSDQKIEQAARQEIKYSGIKGQIHLNDKPAEGVRVHVYSHDEKTYKGEGLTFSAPTDTKGNFLLHLKPGSYQLVARKHVPPSIDPVSGAETFPGRNLAKPVSVAENMITRVCIPLESPE